MEAKTRVRKRQAKKQAVVAAAAPPSLRTATDAAGTESTDLDDAQQQPKPSLSQRVARSLRSLGQLRTVAEAEEEGEVEQPPPGSPAGTPPQGQAAQEGVEPELTGSPGGWELVVEESAEELAGGGWRSVLGRGAVAAATRLHALTPGVRQGSAFWPALAALLVALLVLGAGVATRRVQASWRGPSTFELRVSGELESAAAARAQLHARLHLMEQRVQEVSDRLGASAASLEALQQSCHAGASAGVGAAADLAQVQDEVAQLRQAMAAAAAAAQPGDPHSQHVLPGDLVRQVVREQVAEAFERFAADRTGLVDYALAANGAAVVAHSPAILPPWSYSTSRLFAGVLLKNRRIWLHPHASQLLLAPTSQPGDCLALVGGSGYVDVRLAAPVRPSAFTYEHIPAAIAHDIRSAPRNLTLTGFLVGGPPGNSGPARGVPLGTFVYDARSRQPVQTFQLAPEAQAAPIDHVRLAVDSHHGHPRYTCLYRLRVHGTPA